MSPLPLAVFLAVWAAGTSAPPRSSAAPAPGPAKDLAAEESQLKEAGLPVTGAGLLDFFRKRTPPGPPPEVIAGLVRQLSDKTQSTHEQASAELIALGSAAIAPLRPAANNYDDEEGSGRARHCLDCIEGPRAAFLAVAAARLVGAHRPEGAAAVLMGYVPFADNDEVVQEVEAALQAVGLRDGKVDPALLGALQDAVPVRRNVAARVLCQIGGSAERTAVHALLADARPTVRLQAALGLAAVGDGTAVPVLIDLLAELPADSRRQAEEFLSELAGDWALVVPQGSDPLAARLRREAWAAWWRATDGPALLDELRRRTLTDEERQRVLTWIGQLEDPSATVRDRAASSLVDFGPRAVPLLRRAIQEGNPRLAPAAAQCLESLEEGRTTRPLPATTLRLLALRRPEGAVEALLRYLPFSEGENTWDQLVELLAALGCTQGKADAALVQALSDKVPERRAAAASALVRGRAGEQRGAVRKLLRDPDRVVRMRTALALADSGEREAVVALIGLLGELPNERVGEVVEYLGQLAGDGAPQAYVEAEPAARAATVEAWRTWWREKGPGVDLVREDASRRQRGLLLVIEHQGPRGTGRVLEATTSGKIRWQMEGITFPWDAQRLPNGNLLVVDQGNRVCERGRDGKVLWQVSMPNAIGCQRLPNGHTFVLTRNSVHVVDRQGKDVLTHYHPGGWILGGRRFRDGHMAFLTYQGQYVRLDSAGKEVKSFHVPFNPNFGVNGAELIGGDRVLVSLPSPGKVLEYNAEGKVVWEASVPNPGFPTRLPNGHTLVPGNGLTTLTELDRSGRVLSEKKDLPYRPFRVYLR
jgi:HEAT repeat protein